jgi:hypothetical protein
MKQGLIDYNDIFFENLTINMELECFSDDILLDECNHVLSGKYESSIMDNILVNYFKNGKITEEERKKAEGLYILANTELAWEV